VNSFQEKENMARSVLVAFGVIAVLFVGSQRLLSPPATASANSPAEDALAAKPIYVAAKDHVAYTLEKVEFRKLGGRDFLVGREMKDPPYQITRAKFPGATVWVPLDAITEMVELEPRKSEK
jgi:hypothetical protein